MNITKIPLPHIYDAETGRLEWSKMDGTRWGADILPGNSPEEIEELLSDWGGFIAPEIDDAPADLTAVADMLVNALKASARNPACVDEIDPVETAHGVTHRLTIWNNDGAYSEFDPDKLATTVAEWFAAREAPADSNLIGPHITLDNVAAALEAGPGRPVRRDARAMPVFLNGKAAGQIKVKAGLTDSEIERIVFDDPDIQARLEGLTVSKVIVWQDRMVHIVAGGDR